MPLPGPTRALIAPAIAFLAPAHPDSSAHPGPATRGHEPGPAQARSNPTQAHHHRQTPQSGRPLPLRSLVQAALVVLCLGLSSCLGIDPAPYQSKPGYPGSQTSAQFTQSMFKEVNAYRQNEGYKPLEWDPLLAELSAQHAVDMAQRATMDHDGFKERYQESGYTLCVENVASSPGSALHVLGLWQRSPGHDANLLNADIKRVGVAKSGRFISWMACRP